MIYTACLIDSHHAPLIDSQEDELYRSRLLHRAAASIYKADAERAKGATAAAAAATGSVRRAPPADVDRVVALYYKYDVHRSAQLDRAAFVRLKQVRAAVRP